MGFDDSCSDGKQMRSEDRKDSDASSGCQQISKIRRKEEDRTHNHHPEEKEYQYNTQQFHSRPTSIASEACRPAASKQTDISFSKGNIIEDDCSRWDDTRSPTPTSNGPILSSREQGALSLLTLSRYRDTTPEIKETDSSTSSLSSTTNYRAAESTASSFYHRNDKTHESSTRIIVNVIEKDSECVSTCTIKNIQHCEDVSNHEEIRMNRFDRSRRKSEIQADTFLDRSSSEDKNLCSSLLPHPSCINRNFQGEMIITPDAYVSLLFQYCVGFEPIHRSSLELLQIQQPPSIDILQSISSKEENPSNSKKDAIDSPHGIFPAITEEELSNYTSELVEATRNGDIDRLRSFLKLGHCLSSCNTFGESLLHMACRRGYTEVVKFLLQEAMVSPRRTDDGGRTPLHDSLWNRDPQYEIVEAVILCEPVLLLCVDKRGFAPFKYARREHYVDWIQFLWDRKDQLKALFKNVTETCSDSDSSCCCMNQNHGTSVHSNLKITETFFRKT